MNIFILDESPTESAKMYCDKHVPKMVVELYQMMGSALRRHGAVDDIMPLTKSGTPLKGGYHKHPCTLWTGDSRENFIWASFHGAMLCEEYESRFGKSHFCVDAIEQMFHMRDIIPEGDLTPFAQAMPDEYRNDDAVKAYRTYYKNDKAHFARWNKGRVAPYWWSEDFIYGVTA